MIRKTYTQKIFYLFIKKEKTFVCEREKEILGFINFELHGTYIYLKLICVLKKYGNKRVGKKLISFLEDYAKKNKVSQIEMFVERKNNKMIILLKKEDI
ncbi:MAG: GNAT family N-acetyltransferase [Candidatus Pacearchaeota archaeon]